MKVKLMTTMAGPQGVTHPGSVIDIPEDEALRLVRGGFAEALEETKKQEFSQVIPAMETAEEPTTKRKGRRE